MLVKKLYNYGAVMIVLLFVMSYLGVLLEPVNGTPEPSEKVCKDGSRSLEVPEWKTGDWWKYYEHDDEDVTFDSGTYSVTIEESTTVVTMIVDGEETVELNGTTYDVYNVTLTGHTAQEGTASFMGYYGDYMDIGDMTGYGYYRRSDLAYIWEDIHNDGDVIIHMAGETYESNHQDHITTFAQPPLENFIFPMSTGATWSVNTVLEINQTITAEGETESDEVLMRYNFGATVEMEKTGDVLGEETDYYPLHYVGTVTVDGFASVFNTYNNYSATIKNSIDSLLGYGDITNPPGSGDLSVSESSFSIIPDIPRENVPFNITCDISNEGDGKVVGVSVKAVLDGTQMGDDLLINTIDAGGNVTLDYSIGPLSEGAHTLEIEVDHNDHIAESDEENNHHSFEFDVTPNHIPEIQAVTPVLDKIIVNSNATVEFVVEASDIDGDELLYQWSLDGENVSGQIYSSFLHCFADGLAGEEYIVLIEITDGFGGQTSHEWEVEINTPPSITAHIPLHSNVIVDEGEAISFSVNIQNDGVGNLAFYWYFGNNSISGQHSTSFIYQTFFEGMNSSEHSPYEITFVVRDAANLSDSFTWEVEVRNVNRGPNITAFDPAVPASEKLVIKEDGSVTLNITAFDPDGDGLTYRWFIDEIPLEGQVNSFYIFQADHDMVSHAQSRLISEYKVRIEVSDGVAVNSFQWTVEVEDINRVPQIINLTPLELNSGVLKVGDKENFSSVNIDPDGDVLSYQWYLNGDKLTVAETFVYSFEAGEHSLKLIVNDGRGGVDSAFLNFTVVSQYTTDDDDSWAGKEENTDSDGDAISPFIIILIVVLLVISIVGIVLFLVRRKKDSSVIFKGDHGHSEDEGQGD